MSAASQVLQSQPNTRSSIHIEENATLPKALSYIPLFGILPSVFQESSLATKIGQTKDVPRLVQLIDVKNQYKIANAVRNLLTAALCVAAIALGIISGSFAQVAFISVLHGVLAGLNLYRINQNNRVVEELKATGVRPGMQVM